MVHLTETKLEGYRQTSEALKSHHCLLSPFFCSGFSHLPFLCFALRYSPPLQSGFLPLFSHGQWKLPSLVVPVITPLQPLGLNSKFRDESISNWLGVGHMSGTDWIFWAKWIGCDWLILDTAHSSKWFQWFMQKLYSLCEKFRMNLQWIL